MKVTLDEYSQVMSRIFQKKSQMSYVYLPALLLQVRLLKLNYTKTHTDSEVMLSSPSFFFFFDKAGHMYTRQLEIFCGHARAILTHRRTHVFLVEHATGLFTPDYVLTRGSQWG